MDRQQNYAQGSAEILMDQKDQELDTRQSLARMESVSRTTTGC